VSLHTRHLRVAEYLGDILNRAFSAKIAETRAMPAAPNAPDLAAILREHLRAELERALSPLEPYPRMLWPEEMLEDGLADTRRALRQRDPQNMEHVVSRLMVQHNLPEAVRHPLGIGVLEAEARIYEEALRRARGDVPALLQVEVDLPGQSHEPLAPSAPPPPAPTSAPMASSLVEPYFKRRETLDRSLHQVMNQDRATLRRFLEACGDRPVDAYGRGDVTGFLDTMRRLPNTYGKSPRDKDRSLLEIIAEGEEKGLPKLMDRTVKRHLSALSQFFQYALDNGHLTNAQRIELVEDHRFRENKGAREQRDAWTSQELVQLFSSPVWTGCLSDHRRAEPGSMIIRDSKFWLPLLALFHGARLEELADLYGRDVFKEDDTWALRMVETEDGDGTKRRRLKTAAATRIVPLHPEMIRLGFLAYVQQTAPRPDDPLFPDLEPQGKDGKRGPRFTRWFNHYRQAVGLYREGVAMHAFRHTVRTRLGDVAHAERERHVDFILGHGRGGSEGRTRYDKGPGLKAAAETLALLTYPEVDLGRLYVG
jgi:integrase